MQEGVGEKRERDQRPETEGGERDIDKSCIHSPHTHLPQYLSPSQSLRLFLPLLLQLQHCEFVHDLALYIL